MAELVNEVRTAQHVVTGENRAEFMAKRLDMAAPEKKAEAPAEKKDEKKLEIPKLGDAKPEEKKDETEKKEAPIAERFSKMAEQRKAAEARAEAAEARAKAAEEKLAAPPPAAPAPVDEKIGKKPSRDQFASDAEYTEKLIDWSIKNDRAERAAEAEAARFKESQEKLRSTWKERLVETEKELPDFKEKIEAAADVSFSDQVRDAIFKSKVGPRILYYYADHKDEARALQGLDAIDAVLEIGRLTVELTPSKKGATSQPQEVEKREVHVSKAPAPISALKGSSAPDNLVGSDGKFTGDYSQYKALRKAGKI